VIRGSIGFAGVLVSDDIGMGALAGGFGAGGFGERAAGALAAGCDVAMHCSGRLDEMEAAAAGASPLTPEAAARIARGEALRRASFREFDRRAAEARFDALAGALTGAIAR
jgi:beta-N-acetylhexosaminidase